MSEAGSWLLVLVAAPLALVALGAAGLAKASSELALSSYGSLGTSDDLGEDLRRRIAHHADLLSGQSSALTVLSQHSAFDPTGAKRLMRATAGDLRTTALDRLVRAEAIQCALQETGPIGAVAQRWHADTLSQAETRLAEAGDLLSRGRLAEAGRLAAAAEDQLAIAAHDAVDRIVSAERIVVADATNRALGRLGYDVSLAHANGQSGLWATRGDAAVAARISGSGEMEIDLSGHTGLACSLEAHQIERALRDEGLAVRRAAETVHGRRDGGLLIQAASRTSRSTGLPREQAIIAMSSPEGQHGDAPAPIQRPREAEQQRLRRARAFLRAQRRVAR